MAVSAANATDVVVNEVMSMKGVYASGTIPASEESTYRYAVDSSNNTLRKVTGSSVSINPYRAYFELSGIDNGSNEGRSIIRMNFGGEITGINEAKAEAVQKDGKFFKNGKLFIFKNGKKYNANGQLVK